MPLARLAAQMNRPPAGPVVAAMAHDYVSARQVANMLAYIGFGSRASPDGEGFDTLGGPRKSDADNL